MKLLVALIACWAFALCKCMDPASLVAKVGELNLSMLASAASSEVHGENDFTASQMDLIGTIQQLNPGEEEVVESTSLLDDVSSCDEEEDVEAGMGAMEHQSHKDYKKQQQERKQKAKVATSLPERHGSDWTGAMEYFKSSKRYSEAMDDFALWLDCQSSSSQGVLLERLACNYFKWNNGNRCNRGTTMRSLQSVFVKFWTYVYNKNFKQLAPQISDLISTWEKVQPAVKKSHVSYTYMYMGKKCRLFLMCFFCCC
jgi:hypothetical protein